MKLFLFIVSTFLFSELHAQIYSKKKKIEYEVFYVSNNDTIKKNSVFLNCLGRRWVSPKDKSIIKDFWAITWGYNKQGRMYEDGTGVKETSKEIFLHPIRSSEYKILEFCPFPIIKFPLKEGCSWVWTLRNIPSTYFESLKNIPSRYTSDIEVVNSYCVERKGSYFSQNKLCMVNYFEVVAVGVSPLGKTGLSFCFSESDGFLNMKFKTLNNDIIIFIKKESSIWNKPIYY